MFHVKQPARALFPDAKPSEQRVKHIFGTRPPSQSVEREPGLAEFFSGYQQICRFGGG